jgi:hypothetical protein
VEKYMNDRDDLRRNKGCRPEGTSMSFRIRQEDETEADDPSDLPPDIASSRKKNKKKPSGVTSGKLGNLIDKASIYWGKLLKHQSDRSLKKIYFPQGIASGETSKFTCTEMPGVLLLHVILLSSEIGRQFFETPDQKEDFKKTLRDGGFKFQMDSLRTADYIWAFEEVILMYEMLQSDVMTVAFVEKELDGYIEEFMKRWVRCIPRDTGHQWGILKFHSLMHLTEMLLDMGNARSTDTETGEFAHILNKILGKRTQQIFSFFLKQLAQRRAENEIIHKARAEFSLPVNADPVPSTTMLCSSKKFRFDHSGKMYHLEKGIPAKWHDPLLQERVEVFCHKVLGSGSSHRRTFVGSYLLCSEFRSKGILYRADPTFHSTSDLGRGWHDLAMVRPRLGASREPATSAFPVRLLGFVVVDGISQTFQVPKTHRPSQYKVSPRVAEGSVLALVQELMLDMDGDKPHPQTRLLSYARKLPGIKLIRVEDICATCLGVPDLELNEIPVPNKKFQTVYGIRELTQKKKIRPKNRGEPETVEIHELYIIVKSRKDWPQLYRDYIHDWYIRSGGGNAYPSPMRKKRRGNN